MIKRWAFFLFVLSVIGITKVGGAEFRFGPGSPSVPNDRSELYLIGHIVEGDYERFREAVRSAEGSFLTLQLRSTGGNVQEAIKIGRLVRALYMYTSSPFDRDLSSGQWLAGICEYDQQVVGQQVPCGCASACVFIFFAGVFRNGSELYVHRIAYDKEFFGGLSPEEAQRKYQEATEKVRSYLNEMGIDEKYYYRMLRTSSGEADKLSFEEAAQLDGWVPAVQEWLIAKCGNFEAFQQNIGNCWTNAYLVAQRDAYKREFGEGRSVSPPIAPQIGVAKQWNHNGSTLTLEANGASGRFVFIEPRVGLREVGVTQGMVALKGSDLVMSTKALLMYFPGYVGQSDIQ